MLIEEEEKKTAAFMNYPKKNQESLLKLRREHDTAVQTLQDAIQQSQSQINIRDVQKYYDQLIALKHTGEQFRKMMDITILSKQREFKYLEKIGLDLV